MDDHDAWTRAGRLVCDCHPATPRHTNGLGVTECRSCGRLTISTPMAVELLRRDASVS